MGSRLGAGSGRIEPVADLPRRARGDNPLTKQTALPWWLCEDNPGFGDWKIASKDSIDRAVRQRAREEEWRLLYVACTRARRRLVCSAAQWYSGPASPQGPSEFYAFVSGQSDLVHERFRHDPPDTDPQVSQMRARQAAVTCPPGATGSSSGASSAAPTQPSLFDHPASRPPPATAPDRVSVTELVSYRRCPRQYYWLVVRPLPRRASAAARLGTAAHRWIEQRAANQLGLFGLLEAAPEAASDDPGEPAVGLDEALGGPSLSGAGGALPVGALPDRLLSDGVLPDGVSDGALSDRPASFERALAGLQAAFLATPFAALDPRRVEAPFVLSVSGTILRGRIDAAYQRDGRLEVVDFKTGRPPEDGDPGASVQLDTYAVAAVEVWSEDPAALRTTYCYLSPGRRLPPGVVGLDAGSGGDRPGRHRHDPRPARPLRVDRHPRSVVSPVRVARGLPGGTGVPFPSRVPRRRRGVTEGPTANPVAVVTEPHLPCSACRHQSLVSRRPPRALAPAPAPNPDRDGERWPSTSGRCVDTGSFGS